jgi:DNA-binding winged helix-turn-helix (wHTH) protein
MGRSRREIDQSACFEFSGFRLDAGNRQLFDADGQLVALKPKVFDTLLHLVHHSGELLEKSALLEAVWGKVVVSDNSLSQHVSMLRRALGEHPGEQRFIKTESGHGYRFVAEVSRPDEDRPDGANWGLMKDPLRVELATDREIVMSRHIAATPARAFAVWVDTKLLPRWYPPQGWFMAECTLELRPGGTMRFVTRNADGMEITQQGEIREVAPPHRLVHVERWENPYMREVLVTTTFPVEREYTKLNVRVRYADRHSRDAFVDSGLVQDIGASYARFARLAETGSL